MHCHQTNITDRILLKPVLRILCISHYLQGIKKIYFYGQSYVTVFFCVLLVVFQKKSIKTFLWWLINVVIECQSFPSPFVFSFFFTRLKDAIHSLFVSDQNVIKKAESNINEFFSINLLLHSLRLIFFFAWFLWYQQFLI